MAIILGTAGHIDHGKTSLVQALTGIDCDRLHEEKRRGITIELGFAYYDTPKGERLGIIDVPGHEKFIKNMVAGASGISLVMLVISADEGVMPQTKEHLEICSLLGIQHGCVTLTRIDTVNNEWLELTKEDITTFLKGTFLENAPIFPVSSITGEGLENLKTYLDQQIITAKPKQTTDIFRLAIDRIFTLKGHGTVVTGTIISGSVSIGESLEVLPSTIITKVKNIQCHNDTVQTAYAGQRTAINLQGLDISESNRGDILAKPHTLFPSKRWLIRLTALTSLPRPLRHRSEVHFHHGTQEVLARLYFLDKDTLEPGETVLCEARFHKPLIGVFNDHCVIRTFSPLQTVAGGVILNPLENNITRKTLTPEKNHTYLTLTSSDEETLVQKQIELLGTTGVSITKLSVLTNLSTKQLIHLLLQLEKKGSILCFDKENQGYISATIMKTLCKNCLLAAKAFHKKEPLKKGMAKGVLTSTTQGWGKNLPHKLVHFVIEILLKNKELIPIGESLSLASHNISLDPEQQQQYTTILNSYLKAGYSPPNLNELLEKLHIDPKKASSIIKLLIDQGLLIRITDTLYYPTQTIDILKTILQKWFATHKELDVSEFKELIGGLSRKYTIPLLEYFDKERFTMRIGDKRQLRKNS